MNNVGYVHRPSHTPHWEWTKCAFLTAWQTLLRPAAAGLFFALCWGDCGGPAGTLWRMLGPRPGSVARALGIESRACWLVFKALHPAPLSQGDPWKPRKYFYFLFFTIYSFLFSALLLFLKHHSSAQRLGSHEATPAALQASASPVVTAWFGVFVSVRS